MWAQHRKSTAQRGYGAAHRRRRRVLLPLAIGKNCPMCDEIMLASQKLELDHSIPVALGGLIGDRIVHGKCNLREGAKLGNQRQKAVTSRTWLVDESAGTPSRDW